MSKDKDLYHPARLADTIIGDHDLAKIARLLRNYLWKERKTHIGNPEYTKLFEEEFGIRLIFDELGLGFERAEIIDEQKYLLFILKYQ